MWFRRAEPRATGWNFRHARVGNPGDIYQTLGAYIPFALTRTAREAAFDPRRSVAERYQDLTDYLRQVRSAADGLVVRRFLLREDVDEVMARGLTGISPKRRARRSLSSGLDPTLRRSVSA